MRGRAPTSGLMVLGFLLAAACGGDGADAPDIAATPAPEEEATEPGGADVTMVDNSFRPDALEVAMVDGGVDLELANDGQSSHTFTVDELGVDVVVEGGGTGRAAASVPEAGDYDFRCRFHANMTGTLTVAE